MANINGNKLVENFRFSNLPDNRKKLFLLLLGLDIDKEGFIIKDGVRQKCPYTDEYVLFKEASIMPGSTIVMKTSPYTLSAYISDHLAGEVQKDGI